MMGTPVQGGQEGTIHQLTYHVDLYVDAVCHIDCITALDRHTHTLIDNVATHHLPVSQCVTSHHMHIQIVMEGIYVNSNLLAIL